MTRLRAMEIVLGADDPIAEKAQVGSVRDSFICCEVEVDKLASAVPLRETVKSHPSHFE